MNDDFRDLLYYVSISDQRNAKGKAIEICEKELAKGDILPGSIDPRLLEGRKAGSPEIALRRPKL